MSAIPSHLAHRPVWHGMPVPYINVWGDERDEHKTVPMLDPVIGQLCWFNAPLQLPETGEPDLGQQSLQRQRRVVIEGLCQVCGRPLPLGPRWLIAGRGTYERIEWNGRPVPAVHACHLPGHPPRAARRHPRRRDARASLVSLVEPREP
jgi:hypothetical protein